MIRLDKYLCDMGMGTRSSVKKEIRNGSVMIDGVVCKSADRKFDESVARISYMGKEISYERYVYYVINKPAGVVTATRDNHDKTVMECIENCREDLFPVGRLDKDTEGLLLITNDGELAHKLLSPRHHVRKEYECILRDPITKEAVLCLEQGVDIGDKQLTKPAVVKVLNDRLIHLSITEGRFHQVKRMLKAVRNEVLHLKRIRMGSLVLDEDLPIGSYRRLTGEEITELKKTIDNMNGSDKNSEYEAVIFDLDGTLVDSMWMWKEIDIEYLSGFGIELPEDLQSCIEGMSFTETAAYFKERFQIPDSLEKMKSDWNRMAYDKYAYEVPLKSGIIELLDYCKSRNIKLGIATSNSCELVENILSVHKLDNYFACIMTGSDVIKGKPAPDIYLEVAKKMEVAPAKCFVFEDLVAGISAAKAAGMTVCAVKDDYSSHQDEQKKELADYYTDDFTEFISKEIL